MNAAWNNQVYIYEIVSINLVKIHATGSTNEELKFRFRESELPNLTTVYTSHQTAGKGQMGARWESEPFKNLTFSILVTDFPVNLDDFKLNKLITVALVEWLRIKLQIQAVIKWPNDILSVRHKLAGLLIENIYKGNQRAGTVVGIGLNVNQKEFSNLPKAISLYQITGKEYDIEELLIDFLNHLKLTLKKPHECISRYERHLFKYHQEAQFRSGGAVFSAIVKGVDENGKLLLQQEEQLKHYDLKEVEWIY